MYNVIANLQKELGLPVMIGLLIGLTFQFMDAQNQIKAISVILSTANKELFNFAALLGVVLISIQFLVFGGIRQNMPRYQSWLIFTPITIAFSCSVPFFTALFAFFISYSGEENINLLMVLSIYAFLVTVGVLVGFLVLAHEDILSSNLQSKRLIFFSVLIASIITFFISY